MGVLGLLQQVDNQGSSRHLAGTAAPEPPQKVTRDFVGAVTLDRECAKSAPDVVGAAAASMKRQRAWLARTESSRGRCADNSWWPAKRLRVAWYRNLRYLDHQLQVSGTGGLGHFATEGWQPDRWDQWPQLTICWDQESANVASGFFLMHSPHKITCEILWGPAHGAWKDIHLAAKDNSWYSWVLGLMLIWNQPHGPWADDTRTSQVKQTSEDFSWPEFDSPPPLGAARAHDMLEQAGKADTAADPKALQEVWDDFRFNSCFKRKGSKVIWGAWVGVLQYWAQTSHMAARHMS